MTTISGQALHEPCTFVELPPQKEDLSSRITLPPSSRMVFAADTPARPPPSTMACLVSD